MAAVSSPDSSSTAARVLIVDDDITITDTLSRLLRLEGYEVWAALSADEGLRLARAHLPHAIILALRMPLTSGLQVLRALRAIPALTSTPVGIVTGEFRVHEDGRAGEIEALGAVLRFKPVWVEELVSLAHELVHAPVQD
jgi:DNA-binding response OmpR family regulator